MPETFDIWVEPDYLDETDEPWIEWVTEGPDGPEPVMTAPLSIYLAASAINEH